MKKFKYMRHRLYRTNGVFVKNLLVLQVGTMEEPHYDSPPNYKGKIIWRDATVEDMTEEVYENNL